MGKMFSWFMVSVKALKPWQTAALGVAVLGSAWATYGVIANTTSANQVDLTANQQIFPVQYGDLMNQVSTNGTLIFPERETLTFGSAGTVARVLVKEGERVTQGQSLAELDHASVIFLEQAAAQARVDRQAVQTALGLLEAELALDFATAEQEVASAQLNLNSANNALSAARNPDAQVAIKTQEEAVVNAQVGLQEANRALISLSPSHARELADAIKAKTSAQTALKEARDQLKNFDADYDSQLAAALKARAAAEVAVDDAQIAITSYEKANENWLGPALKEKSAAEMELTNTQAKLDQLRSAEAQSGGLGGAILQWQNFLLIRQENLKNLQSQTAEAEQLEATLDLAERELSQAKNLLDDLQSGSDNLQVLDLESVVEVARADLAIADEDLNNIDIGVDPLKAAVTQAQVSLAEATLTKAERDLSDLVESHSLDVTLKEKEVAVARQSLAAAQKALELKQQGADHPEIALKQAALASAEQDLANTIKSLDNASLKSPISGMVTLVGVEEGDDVEANTTVVEVVDTGVIEIDGIVDEIDVLSVTPGIPTQVTFDALRGQVFEGTVSEISSAAGNQSGVVTYPIKVQVVVPDGVQLREGLTATARIVINEEKSVLLVPQQSLYGTFDQPTVRLMTDSGVEDRAVELGNSDDIYVAVRSGLEEGDRVVMETAEFSTAGSGFGQIRAITGGRGGPAGRSGGR
jgi:RND family efflux transporter MFP subunit